MNEEEAKHVNKITAVLIDVLDGNSRWYEIMAITGLTENRCREIEKLFDRITDHN